MARSSFGTWPQFAMKVKKKLILFKLVNEFRDADTISGPVK